MKTLSVLGALALCLIVMPESAVAQDDDGPEYRYITMSTFHVPMGPERQKVMTFIRNVMAPQAKVNPNVLSFRVALHDYGTDSRDIVLIREYASWEAIDADCGKPCDDYWDANPRPEDGTAEQQAWREAWQAFRDHYAQHSDEIYRVNMDLAKY
jgi:hypothetical protein